MSKYARTHISTQVSAGSDYRGGQTWGAEVTHTPDEYVVGMNVDAVANPGATIDLGNYTTVTQVVLKNTGTTDAFAKFRMLFDTVTPTVTVADADPDTITDDGAGSLFTYWPAGCYVRGTIDGSAQTATLVQAVADNVLTVANAATLTAKSSVASTLYCDVECVVPIPAGKVAVINSPLPDNDLVLLTDSGTSAIDVCIFGT